MPMMLGFDVSLLHGRLPVSLAILAIGSLAMMIIRPGRRWWLRRVVPATLGSVAASAAINWWIDLRSRFGEVIPVRFIIYAAMPIAACSLAVSGWRPSGLWRRAIAVAATPLTLLFAANLVNQSYGYKPTVGALFGARFEHQIPVSQLELRSVTTTASVPPATASVPPATSRPQDIPTPDFRTHGFISEVHIPPTLSQFSARPAWVWVPPAFFRRPRPQLPVVVLLAGTPSQPDDMIRAAHGDAVAERYAAAHAGVAPILVFADGNGSFTADTECVDGRRGNAETYLTKDVPAFVTQAFTTLVGPAHWGIEGYSEGGTCAMVLALAHPDVYGSFVDIAGDRFPNVGSRGDLKKSTITGLYGGNTSLFDAHDPAVLIQQPTAKVVSAWFEAGRNDPRRHHIGSELDAACRAAGLQSRFVLAPGGHDFGLASHAVADSFDWLAARLGA